VTHFFELNTSLFVQFKDSLNRKRGDKLNQNRVDEERKDGKEKWTEEEIKKNRKEEQGEFFNGERG
jgi:hypothetical protein